MHTNNKECIAMLLAGGQGTRLQALTEHIAKPAVTFGGKFRIIDFTLSNCTNSGINTVGVLTQYQPLLLNRYIGSGQPWDMDRLSGGVYILPPYSRVGGALWYSGTANAVCQNIPFIESYNPKYVLVLSGDHIYKMDYGKMLNSHKETGAACTIAVIEVPLKDAPQFGIMNTGIGDRIVEFEEKPKQPKSNTASMGVYIFTWDIMKKYLENDAKDPDSRNDFGKNIIPNMLDDGQKMFAYRFDGYWKDVGTLESLWQANMDMIDDINLGKPGWQILSRTAAKPPHYIGKTGSVKHSLVTEGCEIYGTVTDSVLSHSVIVEEGAVVSNSVIMANAIVRRGAVVEYSILDENSCICEGAAVGGPRELGNPITVIARDESVERGAQASGDIILKDLA